MNIDKTVKNVLVTGARAPVTLHLCRLFKNKGINVFVADCTPYPLSKASNVVSEFFLIPSPKLNTNAFVEEIKKLIQKFHIDLIIPTCEETFYFSKFKDEFNCDVFVDTIDKLTLLHNKLNFIEFIKSIGWDAPETIHTNDMNQCKERLIQSSHHKFVMKPIYSRFSDKVSFTTKELLLSESEKLLPGWIIQQRIEGNQYCSYSIAKDGKLLVHTVYKTEFTAGIGATIAFNHTNVPSITQFVSDVVAKLNFSGQIAFDFIMDNAGIPYPIECNPRATSGLHLFSEELIPVIIENKNSTLLTPSSDQKTALKLALLIYGHHHWNSPLNFKKWLYTFFSHTDIVYNKEDKKPFFYQVYSMYQLWIQSKKHKHSLLEQTTYDISWDGEEQ